MGGWVVGGGRRGGGRRKEKRRKLSLPSESRAPKMLLTRMTEATSAHPRSRYRGRTAVTEEQRRRQRQEQQRQRQRQRQRQQRQQRRRRRRQQQQRDALERYGHTSAARIHLPRYKRFCRPPVPRDYFPAPGRVKQKYDARACRR